jgi:hypothetical protein
MKIVDELNAIRARLIEIKNDIPDIAMESFLWFLEQEFNLNPHSDDDIISRACQECNFVDPKEMCFRCDEKCSNFKCNQRE